jgi:hypothetical protein
MAQSGKPFLRREHMAECQCHIKQKTNLNQISERLRAGLHYGGEGLRSVKNAWPRHGYMRQMVDVPEKN